jgi:uncharacterized protein YdhG (YjbR/CyaY superfamily)
MSTSVMDALQQDLASYDTAKGTVHFPADKPLPDALVTKLVKARIQENEAADAARKAKARARKTG